MAEIVAITGIAAGGAGVGRLADGRAVFVQRTAPGDRARINLIEQKKSFARGVLRALEVEGAGRREAPCPHYERCGGCTLEHLEYEAQLEAKAGLVYDALTRIGKLAVQRPRVIGSPNEFRYRNRVSFTLVRIGNGVIAGFHELDKPGRVVDIGADCLLPEEPVALAWHQLRTVWGAAASKLPSGPQLRLTLRTSAEGNVALVVEGGYSQGKPDELLEAAPLIQSIWHRPRQDSPLQLLAGSEAIVESWQDEDLDLSGSVFLQVNRSAAALLEDYVMQIAGDVNGKQVLDAYCGVGLHARRLARAGAHVTGIELDSLAIDEARAAKIPNTTFVCGRAEDEMPNYLPTDFAIVNPPRAGLHEAATGALNEKPAQRMVYVSCNPATLARDLNRLSAQYQVNSIQCFDLFPQTAHVETVVELACVTS
ncbi:MAG TPA: methyltransferase domain-containing protein [Longimicrobiales bacterium]|nr:methyltransferase domain-containing protein [Longimicrobiales bacterium]